MKKSLFITILVLLVSAAITLSFPGVKQKRPRPSEYGRVVFNTFSKNMNIPPVVFEHWLHRSKYTCRVCHIDLEFSMKVGATEITAADNMGGHYCGACHNGRNAFPSCRTDALPVNNPDCLRCHSLDRKVKMKYDFQEFTQNLPKGRFGNGVDWEVAEHSGKIKPQDVIEGVSMKETFQYANKDFKVHAKLEGFPDIIFSHEKHTIWSGCGGCHPETFGIKQGTTQFTMKDIYQGEYCGVCHGSVAFPIIDCQRCHTNPVR